MNPQFTWIIVVVMLCGTGVVAYLVSRRREMKEILVLPEAVEGFGKRSDRVIITFADGTTRESTWGEIEQKVKDINGVSWWVEERHNITLAVVCSVVGVAATFAVYYLQEYR